MSRHVEARDFASRGDPGPWWVACEHPERPSDVWALWSWDCDRCIIHLATAATVEGDLYAEHFIEAGVCTKTTIADTLTEAREWRAAQGMRPL